MSEQGAEVPVTELEPIRSHFQIPLVCWQCMREMGTLRDDEKEPTTRVTLDLTDDGAYQAECERGHDLSTVLQNPRFELMFESACMALSDGYFHQAVASFAASLDGFHTFLIRVACRHLKLTNDLVAAVTKYARRTEHQPAAVTMGYAAITGAVYKQFPRPKVELRNRVIHEGYFPTFDEAIDYGEAVYDQIIPVIYEVREKVTDAYQIEIALGTSEARKKLEHASADQTPQQSSSTLHMGTILALLEMPRRHRRGFRWRIEGFRNFVGHKKV